MKKYIALIVLMFGLLFSACGNTGNLGEVEDESETPDNLCPYSVMIDGITYCTWSAGPVDDAPDEEYICGIIKSAVSPSTMPTEDDTTNVSAAVGGSYAIVGDEVYVQYMAGEDKGEWFLFTEYISE